MSFRRSFPVKYRANKGTILKRQEVAVVCRRKLSTGYVDWSAGMEELDDREVWSVLEQMRIVIHVQI
jgi:hypothetical protein